MTGIQKKVKPTFSFLGPQGNFDYAQRTPFQTFSCTSWYVSYFVFHCFVFPDGFTVSPG